PLRLRQCPEAVEPDRLGDIVTVDDSPGVPLAGQWQHGVRPGVDPPVDAAGQVDPQEWELWIGDGVDQRPNEMAARRSKLEVLAPERHDAHASSRLRAPEQTGDAVGLQPGA